MFWQITARFKDASNMKKTTRILICVVGCILLIACNQIAFHSTSTPLPRSTLTPMESSVATLIATNTIVPVPTASRAPSATPRPRIEETNIPDLLETSFSIQNVQALDNHTMHKITGWNYGFQEYYDLHPGVGFKNGPSYRWLDTNHLLMHPVIGDITFNIPYSDTFPAVINLGSSEVWIPISDEEWNSDYYLPQWSAKLNLLITSQDNQVFVYSSDGDLINVFQGNLLGVSPSGTKVLMKDGTWIDLSTGKTVDFGWDNNSLRQRGRPSWSANENRVYICCHLYGDASTGEGFWISEDAILIDGKPVQGYLNTSSGQWAGNSYLLPRQLWADTSPIVSLGFIPLFDPSAKTFRNLIEFTGLPVEFNNEYTAISISPNGDYMWLGRPTYEVSYLVDLKARKSQAYTGYPNWSANGQFVIIGEQVVSLSTSGEPRPLPIPPNSPQSWHPTKGVGASISSNEQQNQALFLLDVETLSYKVVTLPSEFQKDDSRVNQILWSPDGAHIALVTADGSLWQIDYPALENVEQLTLPMPAVKDVFWSPDGSYLAFVSDKDIYIVDAIRNP